MTATTTKLKVNGREFLIAAPLETSLLDVLREELRLTGTKRGCDIGACGSCTVLIDGVAKRACKVSLEKAVGTQILTIEGLAEPDGTLHPLQQAFIDAGAVQCGFCTPGMILSAKALLDRTPEPTRAQIKKALQPNLCRCTGYRQIFEAVEAAARMMAGAV